VNSSADTSDHWSGHEEAVPVYPEWVRVLPQSANPSYDRVVLMPGMRLHMRDAAA
jgi:hypothetical protein